MVGKLCAVFVVLSAAVIAGSDSARVSGGGAWAHGSSRLPRGLTGRALEELAAMGPVKPVPLGPIPLFPGDDAPGRLFEPSDLYERIINGDVVDPLLRAPYVAILVSAGQRAMPTLCSGIVIARDVIIVAAHCVTSFDGSRIDAGVFNVCAGLSKRSALGQKAPESFREKCFAVESIAVPEEFVVFQLGYDIAAVKVQGNLKRAGAKVATLGLKATLRQVVATEGFARGWGVTKRGGSRPSDELREADVWLFAFRGALRDAVVDNLCGGNCFVNFDFFDLAWGDFDGSRGGTCGGDSGGPIVVQAHDRPNTSFDKQIVVGLNSFGFVDFERRCIMTPGTFFTRFSHPEIRKFIRSTAKSWNRPLRIAS